MAGSHAITRIITITSLLAGLAGTPECLSQVIPSGYIARNARSQAVHQATRRKVTNPAIPHDTTNIAAFMGTDSTPPLPPSSSLAGSNAASPVSMRTGSFRTTMMRPASVRTVSTRPASVMVAAQDTEQPPAPVAAFPLDPSGPVLEVPAPVHADVIYDQPDVVTEQVLPEFMEGYPTGGCGAPGCGNWLCDGGPNCGASGYTSCEACGGPCRGVCGGYHWIDTLSLFVGVQGFKNGVNRGESGSFGFQEGFNWGSPWVFTPLGMNTQIGFRGSQSDFHGAAFTTSHRGQYFVTAGFFRRCLQGVQYGVVFDYLHDDWYTTIDLSQLRGELSLAGPTGNSFGFAFAQSLDDDDTISVLDGQSVAETWETQDYYTLFWEKASHESRYGTFRLIGGATGEADAIFGTQFKVPLYDNFSLESDFTYLVPNEGAAQGGTQNESWNVGVQLVWYPARSMRRANDVMAPMFDVAGNGSMISRRR